MNEIEKLLRIDKMNKRITLPVDTGMKFNYPASILQDIVRKISIEDIQDYIYRETGSLPDSYQSQMLLDSKIKGLCYDLENAGYEVCGFIHVLTGGLEQQISKLEKENKQLRHNVSVLQRKLNEVNRGE